MTPIISPDIDDYAANHSLAPSPLLDELEAYTRAHCQLPQMLVGRLEGGLLKLLVRLTGARRILEIGMYTGYSALCMAEALPADGSIVACDINPETSKIAQGFFDRSQHGNKITIKLGPALDTLASLAQDAPFDIVFLDADKENYLNYYEAVLPRLRTGGLIIADNVLWSGNVLAPQKPSDHALVAFNDKIQQDDRVENVLLTVRDGVMLIRKR